MGGAPLVSGEVSELATAFHQPRKLAGVKKYLTKRKNPHAGIFLATAGAAVHSLFKLAWNI
jgi:hypothetical protein